MQCFRPSTNYFTCLPSSPAPDPSSNFTDNNFKAKCRAPNHCIYAVFQTLHYRFYIFDPLFPNKLKRKKQSGEFLLGPYAQRKSWDGKKMAFDCIYLFVSHCCCFNVKNVIYIFDPLHAGFIYDPKNVNYIFHASVALHVNSLCT